MGVPLRPSPYLRHVESGTVSISATGQELAFGLARSLTLDATHLVRSLRARSLPLAQTYVSKYLCCSAAGWANPVRHQRPICTLCTS